MSTQRAGWQPLSTYLSLETKPLYAVFYFPARPDLNLPEAISTTPELNDRESTHWHPLEDTACIHTPRPAFSTPLQTLNTRQVAALKLLANGKADLHATIQAGANLSIMSALVKAGLAATTQKDGVKLWEITETGLTKLQSNH